jgi:transcriptional regulator with XRE-family HTH domain
MRLYYSDSVSVCESEPDRTTRHDTGRRATMLDDTLIYMSDAHSRVVLGRLIARLRERDRLDQTELAELAEISRSSVTRIERGDSVRSRQVHRIEDALHQPLGLFEAVLRDDRDFIRELPKLDPNFRALILRWLAEPGDDGQGHAAAG